MQPLKNSKQRPRKGWKQSIKRWPKQTNSWQRMKDLLSKPKLMPNLLTALQSSSSKSCLASLLSLATNSKLKLFSNKMVCSRLFRKMQTLMSSGCITRNQRELSKKQEKLTRRLGHPRDTSSPQSSKMRKASEV